MPEQPRRRPQSRPGPVSDIERFLMEVERLRKKAGDDRPLDEVEVVDQVEVVRPSAPPPPPPPRPVVRMRPRPIEAPEPPPVLEVIPVAHDSTSVGQRAAPAAAATVQALAVVQATQRVATVTAGPRAGTAAREVLALLRSRHNLRAAMVLQEVLGPPMSRRRSARS